jgi:hypothetical protein
VSRASKNLQGLDEDEAKFGPFVLAKEFPFLGRRLLELQQLSIGQNPRSLKRLWNDSGSYHAIRIAITIDAEALLLSLLQLCFQIWPVYSSSKPNAASIEELDFVSELSYLATRANVSTRMAHAD